MTRSSTKSDGVGARGSRAGGGDGCRGAGAGEEDEDEEEPYPRYRLVRNAGSGVNGFALSPCGVCPVFHKCTPLGVISPATCVYMTAWLHSS